MKIAFVVNNTKKEKSHYTTTHLAMVATQMGHESWYVDIDKFSYMPDENIHAKATRVNKTNHRSTHAYLNDLQNSQNHELINLSEVDVVMLRNNPAEDVGRRPWAHLAGVNFSRFAAQKGVIVVNDPDGLCQANNKLYLQKFPASIRPKTLVSRDRQQIKEFYHDMGETMVLKPLYGSGGHNVFLIRPEDTPNINQMIDAVLQEEYVIAQEYLAEAIHGDIRLLMLNGQPLRHKNRYAAIRRIRSNGDMRNNMTVGATSTATIISDEILELAETIRPRLLYDGMFFVGLDIVGNKLLEINVFSPGGIESAETFTGVKFTQLIIQDLERKLGYCRKIRHRPSNKELAVL